MNTATPQPVTAVAAAGNDRTHFLSGPSLFGNPSKTPVMGASETETGVVVFDDGFTNNAICLSMGKGGFNLHMFLNSHEARTIAKALTMAADHADQARAALDADITAATQAAGVEGL